MMKYKFIFLLFIFQNFLLASTSFNRNNELQKKQVNLQWKYESNFPINDLKWKKDNSSELEKFIFTKKNTNKQIQIKSIGRAIKINNEPYPEVSNYVPNAFVEDHQKIITSSLRGISKTRHCVGENFESKCLDAALDIDFNLINISNFSLNPKINIQSLSDRGQSSFGEAITLGFKAAKKFNNKLSLAFGGENLIHFDSKSDLGRNFYFVGSTYYPLNLNDGKSFLILNAGIGSDFFGYKGNGFLGKTTCFGKPNLTGEGENYCTWGPIASASILFNNRISLINEWFGYGYGTGLSIRPFSDQLISLSIYATDYIDGFPSYVDGGCHENNCSARFYGSLSITF